MRGLVGAAREKWNLGQIEKATISKSVLYEVGSSQRCTFNFFDFFFVVV